MATTTARLSPVKTYRENAPTIVYSQVIQRALSEYRSRFRSGTSHALLTDRSDPSQEAVQPKCVPDRRSVPLQRNVLQQQARFDEFVERYNHQRPHQALAMKMPGDLYAGRRASIAVSRISAIRFMTRPSWSPTAAGFASMAERSI